MNHTKIKMLNSGFLFETVCKHDQCTFEYDANSTNSHNNTIHNLVTIIISILLFIIINKCTLIRSLDK